jgi:hypothetical protein
MATVVRMRRLGRAAGAAAIAAAAALAVGGCGGGGDDAGAKRLLDQAFRQPIQSARVTVDLTIEVKGIEELKDPIRLKLTGPYQSGGEKRIPSFDWDVALSGGGQSISAGFLSTGRNVFVGFQGTHYELGEERVGQFNEQIGSRGRGSSLRQFGVDPTAWLSDARDEGSETVAGVDTTHVSAKVDVGRMLADLNKLVERAGSSVTGAPPPAQLTPEQRQQIEEVVEDPRFDVYVGKADKKIRRLSADLELSVPEEDRERVQGLEGGTIELTVVLAEVGKPQRVEAPRRARPLEELTSQLGGIGALSGGVGPQNGTPPPTDGSPPPPQAPGSGTSGEEQALERYSRCLEAADPSDLPAIERCSEVLR